jgi:hypothetical protein
VAMGILPSEATPPACHARATTSPCTTTNTP